MSETRKAGQEKKKSGIRERLKSSHLTNLLIILVTGLLVFALYCLVFAPKRYDLTVGSIARETINATKDVVDEVRTEEKRQAAAAAVEPTYRFQEGVKEEVLTSLNQVFNELRTVQQYSQTLLDEEGRVKRSFSDAEIEYAQSLVSSITLNRYQATTLLRTSNEAFEDMVTTVGTAVSNTLNTTVREGQITQAVQNVLQIVGYKLDISLTQNILPAVLRYCMKPNMVIEQETTDIARRAAMDAVEPIVYLQGQNIVRAGDLITPSQLQMLKNLGLLKDDIYDFASYQGAALLVLSAMLCYIFSLRLVAKDVLYDTRKLTVAMIVTLLGTAASALSHLFFSVYFVPMSFAPIMLCVLLGSKAGFASVAPMAILISGLAAGSDSTYVYEMILLLIMTLTGGICAARFMKAHPQRIRVLMAGLISAVENVIVIVSIRWMTSTDTVDLLSTCGWAMGGGLLSGVLTLSFQPVFEAAFHLATPSKLQELCNPNQPLLRRLQLEAPGTYHHSLIVANLAEAAAEKIGANPYLARAAGYYHDIGKLKRPQYFKENQMGDNLHDKLDPFVSAAILTSHTKDGYQTALQQRMPQEVAEIILQHHGDTPVMFFYHKALQMSNGNPVDIAEFRYEGPRPNTKESAIVMLSDTIEAAVRSMPDPTPKAIRQFIERLVRGKLEDGQLSNCPLTLRDIDDICDAFFGILRGVFHERIEYPDVKHRVPVQPQHMQTAVSQPDKNVSQQTTSQQEITAPQQIIQPQPEKPQKTATSQPEKADQQATISQTEKAAQHTQSSSLEKPMDKEEQPLLEYVMEKPAAGSDVQTSSAILREPREDSRE